MYNFTKVSKKVCFALVFVGLFSLNLSTVSAATFSTVPVGSGCNYPCDGYYTGHFNAKIDVTDRSSGYWQTSQFRGTMTRANHNGDQWGIMTLNVYSEGILAYTTNPGKLYTAPNSSYWQKINKSTALRKGKNRVDFNFAYVLKRPNGTVAERWYPIRRASF